MAFEILGVTSSFVVVVRLFVTFLSPSPQSPVMASVDPVFRGSCVPAPLLPLRAPVVVQLCAYC